LCREQVEVLLRNELEETPDLLQRIAAYDQSLPGTLRREGMRRALEAQGIAAAAAARAVAAAAVAAAATQEGADTQDPALQAAAAAAVAAATAAAAAKGSIPVLDGQVQFLGTSTRSLPGFGIHRMPRLGGKRGRPRKQQPAGVWTQRCGLAALCFVSGNQVVEYRVVAGTVPLLPAGVQTQACMHHCEEATRCR
jgi:nucleoid-associated protein YgaU